MIENIRFDQKTHTYTTDDGTILPSVTEITRFLAYDYKSSQPWIAKAAAERGTRVHEACMLIDYGEEPEEDQEISGYLKAYRRFLQDYSPDWKLIEYSLGSKVLGYAGTMDRYGILNGKVAIIDLKTGSQLYHSAVKAQLSGYFWLMANSQYECPETLYALRLDKSGVYELVEESGGHKLFDACKIIHQETRRKK